MPKIISFINQKGGTGKTTLSLNISAILADKGYKVLLIETDAQGNLTNTFIQDPKKTLYDGMVKDNPLHDVIVKTSLNHNLDIIPNNILSCDINLILAPEIARELKLKNALDKDNLIDAVNHIYPDKLLKTTISLNSIYPKMQFKKETILSNKNTKSYLELSKLTEEIING